MPLITKNTYPYLTEHSLNKNLSKAVHLSISLMFLEKILPLSVRRLNYTESSMKTIYGDMDVVVAATTCNAVNTMFVVMKIANILVAIANDVLLMSRSIVYFSSPTSAID